MLPIGCTIPGHAAITNMTRPRSQKDYVKGKIFHSIRLLSVSYLYAILFLFFAMTSFSCPFSILLDSEIVFKYGQTGVNFYLKIFKDFPEKNFIAKVSN